MSKIDIIRAWKDERYRMSLTEAERAQLPPNPAGSLELTDLEMATVSGGTTESVTSFGCCLTVGTCSFNSFGCCPN